MNTSILFCARTEFSIVAIDFVVSPKILRLFVSKKFKSVDNNFKLFEMYHLPEDAFNTASLV